MQKKVLIPLLLLLGAGLSCDMNATRPATTGSISVVLVSPSGEPYLVNSRESGATAELRPVDRRASVTLTSARLIVSGQTSKTVTSSTPGQNGFALVADGLQPGTYSVTVEGLANGQVAHFGQTSGVSVVAGQEARPVVTFPVFQPDIPSAAVEDTSDVLRFTVNWTPVQNATGYLVQWSQSPDMAGASSKTVDGQASASTDVTVAAEGKYYFTVRALNAVVSAGGLASPVKSVFIFQGVATVTVTPPAPGVVAGGTQQMAAEGRDADNNVVSNVSWFWASSNHTVATVDQSGLVSAVAPGTAVITAVGKGMPGSTTLTVTPAPIGPAAKLAFTVQPAGTVAGQTLANVQVSVVTASGQVVTSDDATQVQIAIGSNGGGGTLSGTTLLTVTDGVATFTDLAINKAGAGYTLVATANALTGATSSAFAIAPGSPTKLAFSIQPTNSVAGDPLSPAVQVEIRDANDNLVTTARDEITIAFANNAGSGTLTGTKKVNAINGIASFSGLWVNKAAAGYTLAASSGAFTQATSSAFTISPAAPAKLAFSVQPTSGETNVAIAPAVTVTIADQFDNATTATNSISVSLDANPWKTVFAPGASLRGTLTVAANNGVATFSGLRIDKPAPGYSLSATSGSLTAATSSPFNATLAIQDVTTAESGSHSCGIAAGGTFCWGYNGEGQLGVPNTTSFQDSIAVLADAPQTFVSITAGALHTCGLTAAGAAFCWGYNAQGQLGNNSTTSSSVPVAVQGNHVFAQIDAGYLHTCGVTTASVTTTEDRQVYCWGYNANGQIGDNTTGTNRLVPVQVQDGAGLRVDEAIQVSAGQLHTCAVAPNGNAYCWGYNFYGQLGNGAALDVNTQNGAPSLVPALVTGGIAWASISAGALHTCGISSVPGNPARCWGRNSQGQLGNDASGPGTNTSTPSSVFGGFAWSQISAGSNHTCGVLVTGAGYCWGNNGNGELGDNNAPTDSDQPVPLTLPGGLLFAKISTSANHSCGRTTTSEVFCWGYNGNGQLGSPGTNGNKIGPTQIIQ